MSFDLEIVTRDVDGNEVRIGVVDGMTYNLTPMWYKALPFLTSMSDLQGRSCRELIGPCQDAQFYMEANPGPYRELNPPNGWGDFRGFKEVFVRFTDLCTRHPSGIVHWSG